MLLMKKRPKGKYSQTLGKLLQTHGSGIHSGGNMYACWSDFSAVESIHRKGMIMARLPTSKNM